MAPFPTRRPGPARALFLLAALVFVSAPAHALVDGNAPQRVKKITVQGGSTIIGNTVLASNSGGVVNDVPLASTDTVATVTGLPNDAALVQAYVFWSGSLRVGGFADQLADVQLPDGTIAPNVAVDQCFTLARSGNGISSAYYCRADVTRVLSQHLARLPDGTTTLNGTYNVVNFDAEPGHPDQPGGNFCSDPNDPCQSAFGGWSLILVYSSPSASVTKDIVIYDGFLRMDEICGIDPSNPSSCLTPSSGVSPAITLNGFAAVNRNADVSFFALEGDRQLGSPPQRAENADFMRFNGTELSNSALGVLPKNLFNSVIFNRQGGTPFSGVDIKTVPATLPPPSGFPPMVSSVTIQPGSGDGNPDPGPNFGIEDNGELFYLGNVMLSVDALAPSFRNSTKKVDKTSAAPGDTLTYSIHVENNGTMPANATLKDVIPADVTYVPGSTTLDGSPVPDAGGTSALAGPGLKLGQLWPLGIPGFKQFADVTFKATIKSSFAGGTICNTASLDADYTVPGSGSTTLPTLPIKTNPCTTVTRPNLRQPLLTATVPGTWPDVRPNDRIAYRLTLTNAGAQTASGISISADLPKFVKLVAGSVRVPFGATDASTATGGSNGTGRIVINNVTVPGNFAIDVFFDVQVFDDAAFAAAGGTDGTGLAVRAFLTGPSVDPALAGSDDPQTVLPSDPTTVFVRFGVDLSASQKTVTGDTGGIATPGTRLTWTVRLTNNGAKPATATIADDLPPFLTNCRVVSGPITCAAGGANGSGKITGSGITVPAGGSLDVTFTADVAGTAPDGAQLTNVALLTAAERAGTTWQARAPTVTVKSQVALVSTKTVLDVNGGGIEPGDELLYTITLKNVGNRSTTAATIKDQLDPSLTFVSASDGGTLSAGTVLWTSTTTPALASLTTGQQVTVTLRARINATVPTNTTIANQAISSTPEANTVSDDPNTPATNDATIVKVIAAPSFVDSTKSVVDQNGGTVKPGDLLDWKVDVKNTGRAVGTNIVVTDPLDANLEIVSISGGGTASGNVVTWNIAQLLPGQAATTLVVTTRVKTPLANGTSIANQASIKSAEAPTAVPTDDPSTGAADDATVVKVTSSVSLATSTKTVTDDNGGETLPGDRLTYRIKVIANGDSPAADVTIIDPIDRCLANVTPGANGLYDGTRVRWDKTTTPALANVLPGTPVEVTFTATVAQGLADGTLCSNQASLGTPSIVTPPTVNTDDPATPALNDPTTIKITSRPVLTASTKVAQLVEDANSDGAISPGDKIRYTITVNNTGSDTAKGVTLQDTLSPLLTNVSVSAGGTFTAGVANWTLGDIAALTNKIVTIDATIQKPLDDGTLLDNQGTIRATNVAAPALTDDPATPAPNDVTRIVLKSAPKFVVTKTATDLNGGRVEPTDTIRYTISLKNTGTSLARNVKLADTLDANLTFVTASAGGTFDAATRTVTFAPGTIDLTANPTFTIDAKIAAGLDNGTAIDNQAKTTSNEITTAALSDDPATGVLNDPTRIVVISAADLSTSIKTFVDRNGGDIRPGDIVDYTITVKNTGNAFARAMRIEDPLVAELTAQTPIDGGGTVQGSSVVWTPADPLAPGASVTFKFAAKIALPLADGTEIANQAKLLAQGVVTPFVTDDPTTPTAGDATKFKVKAAPSLAATKTVLDVNGADVRPGDQLDWKLTFRNSGDANATNGTISDVLDPNLEFVSATGGGTFDATSRTVKWTNQIVGVTNDLVLTVSTRAKRPLANGTVLSNQGSISVAELGGSLLTDDPATPAVKDPTRVTVVAKPDLSKSEKRATDLNGGDLSPEDVVEYAITVKNTGDNAATSVVVTDIVDPLLTNVTALDGATFDAGTRKLTWTLPSVDLSPAGDRVLHFRASVAPLLATGTKIANQAFVQSAQTPLAPTDDPSTPAFGDPTSLTVISAPQLQTSTKIVSDDDGGLVRPGDQLTYTIVVKNTGNTYATDVVVEDPIDPQLTDIRPDQGGVFANGRIRWDKTNVPALAKVAPKTQTVTLTFRARIAQNTKNGFTLLNQANLSSAEGVHVVTDDPGTPALGDPTGITTQFPDFTRSVKTVLDENGGDVEPGDWLTYTLRVRNDGVIPANEVVIEDPLDTNLVDVTASNGTIVGGKATWSRAGVPGLAKVDPNQVIDLTLRGRVKALTKNGTVIANQASVKAKELLFPVLTDADLTTADRDPTKVTVVAHPKLDTSTLTVEDPNGDEVRPGDRLVYRLTVKNTGNTVGSRAVVTLTVPPELVDVKLDTPGTLSGRDVKWDRTTVPGLASVVPGTDVVLQFNAAVRSPMRNGTLVSVQGGIAVDELERPSLTDDPATPIIGDPTTVRIFSAPRFTHSEKSITDLNGGSLEAGDEALYEIVVLNDGTEPATGTRVFDVVPAGTTYVPGTFFVNGVRLDDQGAFPLTNGLLVKSKSADAAEGTVLVQDGQSKDAAAVLQFRVKLSRTLVAGTAISNQASISSDATKPQVTDDPSTPMQGDPTVAVVGGGVSLTGARLTWKLVEDRGQPGAVNPGDVVEMSIEVPNAGTVPVSCLVSALPLDTLFDPEGDLALDGKKLTAPLDTDDGEWTNETGSAPTANVRLGELASRGLKTVTLRAKARAGVKGVATAQARISCPGSIAQLTDSDPTVPGDQPASIPVTDGSGTGFSLKSSTKTVEDLNGGEVMPGDVLRYRFTIVNDGPSTAKDVLVTDVLPKGLTFVLNSVHADDGFPLVGDLTEGVSTVSAKIPLLTAGQRLTATFLATVDPKTPIGKPISNRAQVSGPGIDPIMDLGPATVVVGGLAGAAAIAGKVYEDMDDNGSFGGKDVVYGGFQVQLYGRQPSKTEPTMLRSVFSDTNGDYVLPSLPGGEYEVQFRAPDGTLWKRTAASELAGGETRIVDAILVPTGIVYRAADRTGVSGARLYVTYDESMVGKAPPACDEDQTVIRTAIDPALGKEVPRRVGEKCLLPGQQGQHALDTGAYRFDLPDTTEAIDYRLWVAPGSAALSFPSSAHPPESTFAPKGKAAEQHRPKAGPGFDPYYTHLRSTGRPDEVTQNHIPVDALEDALRITKQASRASVHVGEFVTYTVAVTNGSAQDLVTAAGQGGVTVVDAFPQHLRYVRGSARALRRTVGGDVCATIAGGSDTSCAAGKTEPQGALEGAGGLGRFGPYDLKAGESLILRYTLAVTGAAKPGDYDNIAHAEYEGVRVTRDTRATVRVMWDALFDESSVIGKVFCDDDNNGLQTPGELGVGLARIWSDNGYFVEADVEGKFHFAGLRPGLHLFKLDERTLPPGSTAGNAVRQSYYLTPGLDARLNFPVKCDWPESKPDHVRVLKDKPKPPPEPVIPPKPPAVVVVAQIDPPELSVDGLAVKPPMAEVQLELRDENRRASQNAAMANGKLAEELVFRVLAKPGPAPQKWSFAITEAGGAVVHEETGTGMLPPLLTWNGEGANGTAVKEGGRYNYALTLSSAAGFAYTSAPRSFGVEWFDPKVGKPAAPKAAEPLTATLTGELFGVTDAKPKAALINALSLFVSKLPKTDDKVSVVVFTDPFDKNAQKLSDQRAKTVQGLLETQGVASSRIEVVGKGGESPVVVLEVPKGKKPDAKALKAAQQANRRVVLAAVMPTPPAPPPPGVDQPAPQPQIVVNGQPATPGEDGKVRLEVPRPEKGGFNARVVTKTGAAIEANWAPGPRVPAYPATNVLVQVDVKRGLATIGSGDVVLPMLAGDVLLSGGSIVELGDKGPKTALRFGVTGGGAAASWQLTIKDAENLIVKQLDGKTAPPADVTWDGLGPSKAPALRAGTYTYQLSLTDDRGNRLQTARKKFLTYVAPTPIEEVLAATDLFQKPNDAKLKPSAKKALGTLAKRLVAATGNIVIEGHSDTDETLQLTSDRAIAVRAALVDLGVPSDRLTAIGRGAASPRAPNVSPKSREKNRRIEIRTAQKLPLLADDEATTSVKIAGLPAQDAGNGVYSATLGEAPTAPFDIEVTGSTGRLVRYRLEAPPPELHEDKAGSSRLMRMGPLFAQAGDDLPPLPDADFLPPPELDTSGTPATSSGTGETSSGTSTSPSGTAKEPSGTSGSPSGTAKEPSGTSGSPSGTAKEPSGTSGSPSGTAKEPSGTAISTPTPVPDAPAPVPDAPKAVPDAPKPVLAGPSLPADEAVGDKVLVAMFPNDAPPEVLAGKLLVRMPKDHAQLRSTRLLVKGMTDPRNELTINGEKIAVDELGRFWKAMDLAAGEAKVTIETKDAAGNRAILERHYAVDPTGLFLMGIADASGGMTGGELEGTDTVGLKIGGVRRAFLGGRLAGIAAGELNGADYLGGFFKSLKLTANIDSNRRNDDAAFRDLYDPSRYYPIWGDGSTLVQAAPARGPVYARIDADESHALFGDFRTAFGKSDLFRYDRTLYGADVTYQWPVNENYTPTVSLMGAPGDSRVRHGHVEMRATGGSVYYLQSGNVIEGTERVRLVIRDRDTGLELSRTERQRFTDYLVSYVDGRLLFKQPVSSVSDPTFLANTNVTTAQQGHPVFVVVDYEYRDVAGNQGGTLGGYTRQTFFGGLLSLGGGIVQESRGAADPYRLVGAEIGTKKSERTYANLEFGRSWGTDANSFFSSDGGLTYTPLGNQCISPTDPACKSVGNGWKFEAAGELAELLGKKDDLLGVRLYFQNLGRGYFANGALVEQGTMKYGGQIKYPLGPKDAILARHDSVESVLDKDPNAPGFQPKTIIRRVSGLQYRHTEEKWGAVGEYANVLTTDTGTETGKKTIPMDTLVAGGNYRPLKDLNLTLTQEGIVRGDPQLLPTWKDHLTTTVGAQYKLTEGLMATAAESVRWSGENSTQVGLATQVAETGQLYLNERFTSRAGQLMNTTLVGGSAEAWKGAKAYGEYQLDNAMGGQQNRAVLGLNNRWQLKPGLMLSAGYERSQVLGNGSAPLSQGGTTGGITGASPGSTQGNVLGVPPFGAPGMNPTAAITPGATSRDVATAGIEYLANSRFKLSGRFEARYDKADKRFAEGLNKLPGIADRLQLVGIGNADFKWTDDLAVLGRVVYGDGFAKDLLGDAAAKGYQVDSRYLEATAGLALRPVQYDWFAVLMKVSRVIDRRPVDLVAKSWDMQTSDVVSIAPTFETPWKLGVAEKLAFKHVKSDVTGVPTQTSYLVLNVNRLDYHLLPQIDLSLEYRFLWTRIAQDDSNKDAKAQGDLKHGAVFEVAYRPLPFMRVGAGYSFASFSDNELVRLNENTGGFFVRATGQY